MTSASTSAQIALTVKATLERYKLPRISTKPPILTVKEFTVNLCQMAMANASNNAGGQFAHMHIILKENKYHIATKDIMATVTLLTSRWISTLISNRSKKKNSQSTRYYNWKPQ